MINITAKYGNLALYCVFGRGFLLYIDNRTKSAC